MRVLNNTPHAISVTFAIPSAQPMRRGAGFSSILLYPGVTKIDDKLNTDSATAKHIASISTDYQRHKTAGRLIELADVEPAAPSQTTVELHSVLNTPLDLSAIIAEATKATEASAEVAAPAAVQAATPIDDVDAEEVLSSMASSVPTMTWPMEKLQREAKARGIDTENLSKTQLVRALRKVS